jgi:alkanesulfonate monooxygenase SsuD/methylene tetrahydromethanopterin reductase-like flavin-dependent oxidoreductase (luciferase family)
MERHCKNIDRDFSEIEKSCWPSGQILIAKDQEELNQKISKFKPANMSSVEFKRSTLAGTPDECKELLQAYIDLGVTYFMLYFADLPSTGGLRLFAKDVINKM